MPITLFDFFRDITSKPKTDHKNKQHLITNTLTHQVSINQRRAIIPKHMQKDSNNYLTMAARVKHKARAALKNKQYSLAWKLEHERIQHYANQALKRGYNAKKTQSLMAIAYSSLAYILHLENKHIQALAFYLYAIQCNGHINDKERDNIKNVIQAANLAPLISHINNFITHHVSTKSIEQADLLFCQSEVIRWQLQTSNPSKHI